MNVLMFTNTFSPHVGGVARSVAAFANAYTARGHRVLVVAPEVEGHPAHEPGVVRVPAIQHFNGSDFAVPLPVPGLLRSALIAFEPHVVHAHHPFLLGDTALRVAASWDLPVVFTYHTQYERYTHYVPGDSPALKRFIVELATGYANLADAVIAPSASIAAVLVAQGVTAPLHVIPTGVDTAAFCPGARRAARARFGLPRSSRVIGHVGRLAPEKNLEFMTHAVTRVMKRRHDVRFLVAGAGPAAGAIREIAGDEGLADRVHLLGQVTGEALTDAYRAMDAFAFASHTETQGLVLAEALACGVPVVAVDAPGAREVVTAGNGWLIPRDDAAAFARALCALLDVTPAARRARARTCVESARPFALDATAGRALALYRDLIARGRSLHPGPDSLWAASMRRIRRELSIVSNLAGAASGAVLSEGREAA